MIIFQFGWASTQISHLATIPDLAKNQADRTDLTAIRYTMTNLSTIFVYIIGDLLLLPIFDSELVSSGFIYLKKNGGKKPNVCWLLHRNVPF